jgi:uncharacterized membrane protein YbhN (UPF0104 family)
MFINFGTGSYEEAKFGINNQLRFILKLLISLGLIGAILYFIDFKRLAELAVNLNPLYLIGVVGVIYLDRMLMAYKWGNLLRALNVRVPFFISLRLYFVAPLIGMFLPVNIGEDMFRVYSLSWYKVATKALLIPIPSDGVIYGVARSNWYDLYYHGKGTGFYRRSHGVYC